MPHSANSPQSSPSAAANSPAHPEQPSAQAPNAPSTTSSATSSHIRETIARALAAESADHNGLEINIDIDWLGWASAADAVLSALASLGLPADRLKAVARREWQMVPKQPTKAMVEAALDEAGWRVSAYTAPRESGVPVDSDLSEKDAEDINNAGRGALSEIYQAMLLAAAASEERT